MTVNIEVPEEIVNQRIFIIRGQKVMIDRDLSELYGVETKYLNRQVKRNPDRFPDEFMFALTNAEKNELVTNWHRFESLKHSTHLPCAFTEHGVAMLASVLKNERAVKVSVLIIKTFVKLRQIITAHEELKMQFDKLEEKVEKHDDSIRAIFETIQELISPPVQPRKKIGYKIGNE